MELGLDLEWDVKENVVFTRTSVEWQMDGSGSFVSNCHPCMF